MNIKKLRELKKNKKGFTLIEIIVVVVILAVLMAVAVPSVLKYLDEADDAKYMAQARGAMTTTQIELAKAYTAKATTYDAAYAAAIANLSGTKPVVSGIVACTDEAGTKILAGAADPGTVKSYKVSFEGGKTAIVTTNDVVKIQ